MAKKEKRDAQLEELIYILFLLTGDDDLDPHELIDPADKATVLNTAIGDIKNITAPLPKASILMVAGEEEESLINNSTVFDRIISDIEETFSVVFSKKTTKDFKTIGDLHNYVAKLRGI